MIDSRLLVGKNAELIDSKIVKMSCETVAIILIMKSFTSLLSSLILAISFVAIAIFSIQNIQDASIKFITFESITVPVGVLLAFCYALGMVLGALIPILFTRRKTRRS